MFLELLILRSADLELTSRLATAMERDPAVAEYAAWLLAEDERIDLVAAPTMFVIDEASFQLGHELPRIDAGKWVYEFAGVTVEAIRDGDRLDVQVGLDERREPDAPPVRVWTAGTVAAGDTLTLLPGGDLVVLARPAVAGGDLVAYERAHEVRAAELRAVGAGSRRERAAVVAELLGPAVVPALP